jgi:hypothetical protein
VRYSARPGRNSVFPPPSPEDWPFSRTPRMETCVVPPCRSPVPPRPSAPGCSRYGTGGSMAQIKEIGKEYFPTVSGMTSAELKFAPPGDAGHLSRASRWAPPTSQVLGSIADTPAPHSRERHALSGAGDHLPTHSFQGSGDRLRFVDHISSCFARSAELPEPSLRTPSAA